MKVITKKEAKQKSFYFNGRQIIHRKLYQAIKKLDVGKVLEINDNEWRHKNPPTSNLPSYFNVNKYPDFRLRVRRKFDKTGWVIYKEKRIKGELKDSFKLNG